MYVVNRYFYKIEETFILYDLLEVDNVHMIKWRIYAGVSINWLNYSQHTQDSPQLIHQNR